MITEDDVLNALKKACFLARTAELAEKFRRNPDIKKVPTPGKEEVYKMVEKLGYIPRYDYYGYDLVKVGHEIKRREIGFHFYYNWVVFAFEYRDDEGHRVYVNPWWQIKIDISNNEDYRSGSPAYSNYEELEEILAEAISIYEDSVKALYENN